jgi:hypothetical protein
VQCSWFALTEKLVSEGQSLLPSSVRRGNRTLRTMKRNQFLNGPDAAAAGINPKVPPRTAEGLFEDIWIPTRTHLWAYLSSTARSPFGCGSLYWIQHVVVYVLRTHVYEKQQKQCLALPFGSLTSKVPLVVPFAMYLGLSLLWLVNLAMTTWWCYTLWRPDCSKQYRVWDYLVVGIMVTGLAICMHADANLRAVFHSLRITILVILLLCDGTISNMSQRIMTNFGVGQDYGSWSSAWAFWIQQPLPSTSSESALWWGNNYMLSTHTTLFIYSCYSHVDGDIHHILYKATVKRT